MSEPSAFQRLVDAELASSRCKYGPCHSLHEAYAVLLEEVDELWDHVRTRDGLRIEENILKELVQIASVVQRTAEDFGMLKGGES